MEKASARLSKKGITAKTILKEGSIANQKDWHYFLDLLFDGVYNDKD